MVAMRRGVTGVLAGAVLLSALGAGGFAWREHHQGAELDRGARAAADGFASAWARRTLATASYVGSTPSQVAARFAAATKGLGPVPVSVRVTSVDRSSGRQARATLQVSWQLVAGTPGSAAATTPAAWRYTEPVALRRLPGKDRWGVVANGATSLWHPQLRPGSALVARRTWGTRGAIEDRSGAPLLKVGTVHDVQLDPVRATTAAASALEQIVGEPHGSLVKRLRAAHKASNRAPIPVIAYRAADFAAVRKRLAGLTGVIYPSRRAPLAASRLFAQPLLGAYGAVTADTVKRGAGRYVAGDYAGLSGLQGRYDARLGGTPGVTVTTTGAAAKTLFDQPPRNGAPVRLTLDTRTQKAAEAALTRTGSVPSALVALDVRSGDLLAVADSPAFGFDRALQGRYAPGSTLKVATTYSLLSGGLSPSTPVSCPPTVIVDGLRIRNFEGERFGSVPFSADFANSCNTAFAGLSTSMGNGDVHAAALALGVGAGWARHLGVVGAFAGSVPPATSATERAASAFGQGRTLASPASLAVMAGSVARGSYVEPALVSSPGVPGADRTPRPLQSTPAAELRSLMRLVVTSGTARRAFAGLGGAPVFGKTGTAEFGNASPPQTRAWFVGWRGHVAFAVLVERGRSGGAAAAPVARDFLQRLR